MGSQNTSDSQFLNRTSSSDCPYILPFFTAGWSVVIFPLYFLVFHTGFQRWQQNKRSTVSHTDFFTYHMFPYEFLLFCSYVLMSYSALQHDNPLSRCGLDMSIFASAGLLSLHVLTCIERYLAVVYPVVYLSLRTQRWLRARNFIIFIILAIGGLWLYILRAVVEINIPIWCMLGALTGIIMFCSVQVLHALKNPSPGEGRGVSRSKRKAFYTMLAILSTLMFWFLGGIFIYVVNKATRLEPDVMCKIQQFGCLLEFPSSLVLPLLFLHRAGKLPKCPGKKSKDPGLELRG